MKFRLSAGFGEIHPIRNNEPHTGIDIAMPEGTELRAIANSTVEKVFDYGAQNAGRGVVLKLEDGTRAVYGHMSEVSVQKGDVLQFAESIGLSGNTGNSSGAHLHFSLQTPDGTYIDPTPFVDSLDVLSGKMEVGLLEWLRNRGEIDQFDSGDPTSFDRWLSEVSAIDQYQGEGPTAFDRFMNSQMDRFVDWLGTWLQQMFQDFLVNFTAILPDILGYVTILAGILIALSSLLKGRGMIYVLSGYGAIMIAGLMWLIGFK